MIHECGVRRLASGEVAITAESTPSPPVRTGTVLLEVDRSVVDVRHLRQVLSSEQFEQDGKRLGWCSLTGRVAQVGDDVHMPTRQPVGRSWSLWSVQLDGSGSRSVSRCWCSVAAWQGI